jgi:hypothetical protein
MSNPKIKKMKAQLFSYREGFRAGGVPAEIAGAELEKIRLSQGIIKADTVVDAARPDDAPLHPVFEWQDAVAAENYRLYQARNLIRAVCVQTGDKTETAPVYVHVKTAENPGYHHTETVISRPDLYAIALQELQGKVSGALSAVRTLQSLADSRADNELIAKIGIAVTAMETARAAVAAIH